MIFNLTELWNLENLENLNNINHCLTDYYKVKNITFYLFLMKLILITIGMTINDLLN